MLGLTAESGSGEVAGLTLDAEGETWAVSEEGGGRSGTGADIGASLLLVRFSSASPDHLPREALVPAWSLDALGEDALREAFARAKPRRTTPSRAAGDAAESVEVDDSGIDGAAVDGSGVDSAGSGGAGIDGAAVDGPSVSE